MNLDTDTLLWLLQQAFERVETSYNSDLSQHEVRVAHGQSVVGLNGVVMAGDTTNEAMAWMILDLLRDADVNAIARAEAEDAA